MCQITSALSAEYKRKNKKYYSTLCVMMFTFFHTHTHTRTHSLAHSLFLSLSVLFSCFCMQIYSLAHTHTQNSEALCIKLSIEHSTTFDARYSSIILIDVNKNVKDAFVLLQLHDDLLPFTHPLEENNGVNVLSAPVVLHINRYPEKDDVQKLLQAQYVPSNTVIQLTDLCYLSPVVHNAHINELTTMHTYLK